MPLRNDTMQRVYEVADRRRLMALHRQYGTDIINHQRWAHQARAKQQAVELELDEQHPGWREKS